MKRCTGTLVIIVSSARDRLTHLSLKNRGSSIKHGQKQRINLKLKAKTKMNMSNDRKLIGNTDGFKMAIPY